MWRHHYYEQEMVQRDEQKGWIVKNNVYCDHLIIIRQVTAPIKLPSFSLMVKQFSTKPQTHKKTNSFMKQAKFSSHFECVLFFFFFAFKCARSSILIKMLRAIRIIECSQSFLFMVKFTIGFDIHLCSLVFSHNCQHQMQCIGHTIWLHGVVHSPKQTLCNTNKWTLNDNIWPTPSRNFKLQFSNIFTSYCVNNCIPIDLDFVCFVFFFWSKLQTICCFVCVAFYLSMT